MEMATIVRARGLTKCFKSTTVVHGIDFDIQPGRCVGFLGPNGAGKTTILRMILGLSPISGGSLSVFGRALPAAGRYVRAHAGVVSQEDTLDPDFTVLENLYIYAAYFGLAKADVAQRIHELIDFVELADRGDARIPTLSGGMRRRLSIARALINDPQIIILDEPTTGLDPQARHMIWSRLQDLQRAGKTLLLTTHYMEEAERLCDDVLVMDHGRILEQGAPAALVERHVEPEVLELRGAPDLIEDAVDGATDCRVERIGDTAYCYTRDAKALLDQFEQRPGLTYLHRPGNLEDVFLKVTGRDLRD